MSDGVFLEGFEACTLPAAAWTHEAHVRMAWLYLRHHDENDALGLVRRGIQRFNATVTKKPDGYHETITVSFTRLIAHRMAGLQTGHSFEEFRMASPDLLDRMMTALLKHYRRETLFSDAARHGWVEPDLAPLPAMGGRSSC
jgi:hypothetical protein